jgi:hypothetical protein
MPRSAAAASTGSSSMRTASAAIEPLPEQSLGHKRARHSPRTFCSLSLLAQVECQLVLRFLDLRGRLCAARCCRQMYAAASHPFAWPQEQLATLRVPNDAAALQALGAQVRRSLLRLSSIDLRLRPTTSILGPSVFSVPHVHAIRAPHTAGRFRWDLPDSFLPLLCHPQAQQLRSLDISNLGDHQCSHAELQQLASLPRLHSLSLGGALRSEVDSDIAVNAALHRLSLFPSLTHLSINVSNEEPQDYASLWECTRLNSLGLEFATVNTELVNCLARLPLLQRLQLGWCSVEEHKAQAWAALRSLREIQLNSRCEPEKLLPLLSAIPMLRLLRCRWRSPRGVPRPSSPDSCNDRNSPPMLLELLGPLLVASPSLQVELLLPLRFAEWRYRLPDARDVPLCALQQCLWDELHELPIQLPRVRIVEIDPEDEE